MGRIAPELRQDMLITRYGRNNFFVFSLVKSERKQIKDS